MDGAWDGRVAVACTGVLLLTGVCAVACLRLCGLCFPSAEPEVRLVLTNPPSWMAASYPTQVVAACPDPWAERPSDVVVYRTWT